MHTLQKFLTFVNSIGLPEKSLTTETRRTQRKLRDFMEKFSPNLHLFPPRALSASVMNEPFCSGASIEIVIPMRFAPGGPHRPATHISAAFCMRPRKNPRKSSQLSRVRWRSDNSTAICGVFPDSGEADNDRPAKPKAGAQLAKVRNRLPRRDFFPYNLADIVKRSLAFCQ